MELKFNKTENRKFEAGVDRVVLFVWDENRTVPGVGEDADPIPAPGYGKGVVWDGVIAITESPEGADPNVLWADNIKYATLRGAESLRLGIEAYTYPKEWAECDGSKMFSGVAGFKIGQQPRKKFGLCYRTREGDADNVDMPHYKLHFAYGCTASVSDRQYQTINDNPDAITFNWDVETDTVTFKIGSDTYNTALVTIDSVEAGEENYADIEKMVYGTDTVGSTAGTDSYLPMPDELYSALTAS